MTLNTTSVHADRKTEKQMLDNLLALPDTTLVIVSHKSSVIDRADNLIHIK
jgi:ABC-type bacteriocin/lantibiotic exporter with double-glycine peptidase domain